MFHKFLNKLIKDNLFTKNEFFSNSQNVKISLLYELYKKGLIKNDDEENYENIEILLNNIRRDIIDGDIKIGKLDEFLKNDEYIIKQRLSLIKIIDEEFIPDEKYSYLKNINEEINKIITELCFIKDNIIIYYKKTFEDNLKKLIEVTKDYKNKKLVEFKKDKISQPFEDSFLLDKLREKADIIEKVKNFLLFNVIYYMNLYINEEKRFDYAYSQLDEIKKLLLENTSFIKLNNKFQKIFDEIKEKLDYNEERIEKFIQDFVKYYNIKDQKLINQLNIIFEK